MKIREKMKAKKRKSKKGIELDMLGWWIIAIIALIIIVIGIAIMKGIGSGAIEFIQNLFRF